MNEPLPKNKMLISKLILLSRDIKLSHSIFAMPFALLGMFGAACDAGRLPRLGEGVLVVICMILARTFAMLANRFVDREIDAHNPRTANRALPAGQLTINTVIGAMLICVIGLIGAVVMFGVLYQNWWPLLVCPLVIIWLGVYGYFKRFTFGAHFFLGGALALSPLAAGLAVEPSYLAQPTLWLLAGFVMLWVGGFDIIYAMQDIKCDKEQGLHSIPVKFGEQNARWIAKATHLLALFLLVLVQRQTDAFQSHIVVTGTQLTGFSIGLVMVAVLLLIEHRAVSRGQFNMAFFTINGVIALVLGGLGIWDLVGCVAG